MRRINFTIIIALMVASSAQLWAHIDPNSKRPSGIPVNRAECRPGKAEMDMDINNVRARLRTGGDVWWDGSDGLYVVPKPAPGQPAVSAIFAGGVWVGGRDKANNIKLAGVTYRSLQDNYDWYPGPLDGEGQTDENVCSSWDRFFTVLGDDVRAHIDAYDNALLNGTPYNCDSIADAVRFWPGRGNPYWSDKYPFPLPDQPLGAFFDRTSDGIYDPCDGDFPTIEIRDCEFPDRDKAKELVPDQMAFWIYNDNGGTHKLSAGASIQMEVQVQAFAYATNDEINDMSFYRYKLINKADSDIKDCYFGMWVDPDLGCYQDDYSGCDISRELAYTYNEDAVDGSNGATCAGGVFTYGENIPMIGTDYFRGPRGPKVFVKDSNGKQIWDVLFDSAGDTIKVNGKPKLAKRLRDPIEGTGEIDTLIELGMTAFVVTNNSAVGSPPAPTTDPNNRDEEFYNNLKGLWKTGEPITVGGGGYNPVTGKDTTKFAFFDEPNDPKGWSMCTAGLGFGDRRTLQATGPLLLQPGAINELIIGAVFVPDVAHPCPDISKIQSADDIAQALFDNCFDITDGPDAPDVCGVELDRQLILNLTNDDISSNNKFLSYFEKDLRSGIDTVKYKFEGYKLYQLANASITAQELGDVSKARIILQTDLKNNVTELYNWTPVENPNQNIPGQPQGIWTYNRKVAGANKGLQSTLSVIEDQFAKGDRRLVNHKQYHFLVIAYAQNNYLAFDPISGQGQRTQYLEGRGNIKTYSFVPRPIVYNNLNSVYGEGLKVTRISGQGNGGNFLDISSETRETIAKGGIADGKVTYLDGAGPLNVKIYNPIEIKDGKYRVEVSGTFNSQSRVCGLNNDAKYRLFDVTDPSKPLSIGSANSLKELNEQIITKRGFSVTMGQVEEPGKLTAKGQTNGLISISSEYKDPSSKAWFGALTDGGLQELGPIIGPLFDHIANGSALDPQNIYGKANSGFFPFALSRSTPGIIQGQDAPYLSCSNSELQNIVTNQNSGTLRLSDLNNVDIVFTPNKELWSRCIVVETGNKQHKDAGRTLLDGANTNMFDVRKGASIGKDGKPDNTGTGLSWFPGYAVDVETGQRLNIFFGENTAYRDEDVAFLQVATGGNTNICTDMIFNPISTLVSDMQGNGIASLAMNLVAGGQHHIYVTRQKYDECKQLSTELKAGTNSFAKRNGIGAITWSCIPIPSASNPIKSIDQGLIPSEYIVKLRVANGYNKERKLSDIKKFATCEVEDAFPVYEFEISGKQAKELEQTEYSGALANINVVPNPYYAYSAYETSQFTNTVKITNLPERAIINIYSIDGKFIRKYNREERPVAKQGSNPANAFKQGVPDLEWDLKNFSGIPIASGVYLIHIVAPELGEERTIKWFGINRKFDPTGL